jgi:hypothetical protein
MSTAVYVYSVPVDRLRAAAGSRDGKLLGAAGKLKGFFETIDRIAENYEDEEEKPPRCEEAYRQIIDGGPYADRYGYVYGYAYEAICTAIGVETERSWAPIAGSHEWFKSIDEALAALRLKLTVTHLLYRGPLIDIPEPDDFPGLGWWNADEIAAARQVLGALDLKRLDAQAASVVREQADAIEDIRSWIEVAADRPGDWLIGVHR